VAKNDDILRIRQVRSKIGQTAKQRDVLRTLGLRRIGHVVERPDNAAVRGAVRLIGHLVRIEDPSDLAAAGPARPKAVAEPPRKAVKKTTKATEAAPEKKKKKKKKAAAAGDGKTAKKKTTKKKSTKKKSGKKKSAGGGS
jgi:large subunit ribosomal protein L30